MTTPPKRIYLDYAASTPVLPEVVTAMAPYWNLHFGNAGGIHLEGVTAKRAIESARERSAKLLSVTSTEIVFTSGGTESNNLAIFGFAEAWVLSGKSLSECHFITSAIEHASVLDCFRVLEKKGAQLTILPVTPDGIVTPESVRDAITDSTVLVSIMYANSEIGTIQPIRKIGAVIREASPHRRIYFHTDASQAPVYLSCTADTLSVDLMTIDAQKMYGPKGIGFLFIKDGTPIAPIMRGGNQERNLRPGTPDVPLIVAMALVSDRAIEMRDSESSRIHELREYFIDRILSEIPGAELNGSREHRLPNNVNISFLGKSAEMLVLALDQRGVAVATRSACHIGDSAGSHVIRALGKGSEYATSAIRFSLGKGSTKEDLDYTVEMLKEVLG